MIPNAKEVIAETVMEVFENLTFLCPFPLDDGGVDSGGNEAFLGIAFYGEISGKLWISVTDELRDLISTNMLGLGEESDEYEKNYDASKELLNVVCGNILTKLYGDEPVFKVDSPYVVSDIAGEGDLGSSGDRISLSFDVEGNKIALLFCAG